MVIARIEPEWLMGWSVKLGSVFPLTQQYASAKVLAAFQLDARRSLTSNASCGSAASDCAVRAARETSSCSRPRRRT